MTSNNTAPQSVARLKTEYTVTEEVILRRRSVRLYKKEQVPEFMVRRILEAGRFAPSAGNSQPWKFVVLREPKLIQEITGTVVKLCRVFKACLDYTVPGGWWRRPVANLFIRSMPNDLHPTPFSALRMIADGTLKLYHGAPTVILIFKDVRGVSNPDLDCGVAGQNMVLAAHSMGLGTCWVGFTKMAFNYTRKWNKKFSIDYPYKFCTSLAIGWPVGEPDDMIPRQTHAVDWYEYGEKTVHY